MWPKLVLYIVIGGVGAALAQTESKVVQLEQGPVRGYRDASGDLFTFLDVPYATAPTGVNKFKAPLPPPVWTETFDAVERRIACPQAVHPVIPFVFNMQEDCLVANIYVPDTNETNLPVLVYIHGGGYILGFGFMYHFNSLVSTKKAIVVTFNYRVGPHGFLCLGTEDIPGNAGLKDQVALLRWVNRNIARFGGNPDEVTVSGCSAGGGSADFLTLSPMSSGLLKRAVVEGGAALGVAGTQLDPVENAKLYAKQLNFTNVEDFNALEEFYKTASHELLVSEPDFLLEITEGGLLIFGPCVERETGGEIFLHDTPMNILLNGNYTKVPVIYGWAEMEGLIRIADFSNYMDRMNNYFADFLPGDLHFESEAQKEQVAGRVKQFYFGDQEVSAQTIVAYIDYFTDVLFTYPMLRTTNFRRASHGDTIYLYEYSFVDENTPTILDTYLGPGHCMQTMAAADEDETNFTEEYKAMKATMREWWINFITTGNPTPEGSSLPSWPAVDGFVSPSMNLNSTSRVVYEPLLGDRVRLWDAIFEEHFKGPVPPSSAFTATLSFLLLEAALIINYIVN